MIPGSKAPKAVRACTIRFLSLGAKYLLIPISYDRNIIARKRKFVNKTEKTNNSVSIVYIGNIVREQKEKEGRKKVSV